MFRRVVLGDQQEDSDEGGDEDHPDGDGDSRSPGARDH
jgi:hypothetical protein